MKEILIALGVIIVVVGIFFALRPHKTPTAKFSLIPPTATPVAQSPLIITGPTLNSRIGNLLTIGLKLAKPPATIHFRLTDSSGRILIMGDQYVTTPDFQLTSTYAVPGTTAGLLDVNIQNDPHVITIPINFPTKLTHTWVYFYTADCQTLQPVYRVISQKSDTGRSQMDALVSGPTTIDLQNGLKTSIGTSGRINSYKITNGVATVNFNNGVLSYPAGYPELSRCPADLMSAQIKKTLQLSSGVYDVSIAVDNRLPSNLQP